MIFVVIRDNKCMGYCTSLEQAIQNVTKDINNKYKDDDITIDTNRDDTNIKVYKKYTNMNTHPNGVKCLESNYMIYNADFIS